MVPNLAFELETKAEQCRVLVVSDDIQSRRALETALAAVSTRVGVDVCADPDIALAWARDRSFYAIIIDEILFDRPGNELLRALRQLERCSLVPIIMMLGRGGDEVRRQALALGVSDFISKPLNELEIQTRVFNLLGLYARQSNLAATVEQLSDQVHTAQDEATRLDEEMAHRLALAIGTRGDETGQHVHRVASISREIAGAMGLDDETCHRIFLAAPLHDLGKIGIADAILAKPARLNDEEMVQMRRHVELGSQILDDSRSELIQCAALITAHHHERWDGKGYPHGLSGEAIPLEARIVAIADVFDALCSPRQYKPAWPFRQAVNEIEALSGSHFDPRCVNGFMSRLEQIAAIMGMETPAS